MPRRGIRRGPEGDGALKPISHDCIVLGLGGVGSAALHHLARRGARAVGIERFAPGHDRGSSHGDSRIIRLAYFEHPDYVPLLTRAYQLWSELSELAGVKLYHETGLLQVGPRDGTVVPGVLASARMHRLPIEELSSAGAASLFPGFRVPAGHGAVLERTAGYLRVEECVQAHAAEAVRRGAEVRAGEEVGSWRAEGGGFTVTTDRGSYRAGALVITAGAWAAALLQGLGIPLRVLRKPVFWFRSGSPAYQEEAGCPSYLFETEAGIFYGMPESGRKGLKVAEHTGGDPVQDPLAVDRTEHPADRHRVEEFLASHLPGARLDPAGHSVCLYTMTPDEHFVVGRHPEHERAVFAAGLSGHGFKFTSVLGEILAELALDGRTAHPIEFLSPSRPALQVRGRAE